MPVVVTLRHFTPYRDCHLCHNFGGSARGAFRPCGGIGVEFGDTSLAFALPIGFGLCALRWKVQGLEPTVRSGA